MLGGLFSSVNPRFIDYIFAFIFPLGFSTFLYSLEIIAIPIIIYLYSTWIYRHYLLTDKRKSKNILIEIIIILVLSLSNFILLGVLASYLLSKSIKYKIDIIKEYKKSRTSFKAKTSPNKFKIFIIYIDLIINSLIFLLILPFGGFISDYFSLMYLSFVSIGSLISTIYIIIKKPQNLPFYNKGFQFNRISKKKLEAILILIPIFSGIIFISYVPLKVHKNAPNSSTGTDSIDIKIMTYNIRYPTIADGINSWENRKGVFIDYINSYNLDIFCIQEAVISQILYIKENLQARTYKYTGFGRDNGVHNGEHAAIFYDCNKFNFIDGDTFWLSDKPLYPTRTWGNGNYRVCTWARFEEKATKSQFLVFNTHYDFSDEFQEKASILINQKIVELSGGLPVMLMGDFNMRNNSYAFQFLENYGEKPMFDAYKIYHNGAPPIDFSFSRFDANFVPNGEYRIDFMLVSEDITVLNCSIPKDSYGINQTYSDHYPVVSSLSF